MSDQLFYLFSAVLLGLVIGALIMYFSSDSNKDSEKTIAELEKKLNRYQGDVAEHFEQTANLVDDLTHSYKKVFDHMGKSARLLMTEEQIADQIEKRKGHKVTLEFLTVEDTNLEKGQNENQDNNSDQEITNIEEKSDSEEIISEVKVIENISDDSEELTELSSSNVVNSNHSLEDSKKEEIKIADVKSDELIDLEQEVEIREKNIYS